jgi:hypothetical protein
MWGLWWTKRHWGRFSPSTSVSPANHSTNFSIIIITRGWHNRPVSGRSVEWTLLPTPTMQIKKIKNYSFQSHFHSFAHSNYLPIFQCLSSDSKSAGKSTNHKAVLHSGECWFASRLLTIFFTGFTSLSRQMALWRYGPLPPLSFEFNVVSHCITIYLCIRSNTTRLANLLTSVATIRFYVCEDHISGQGRVV